MCYYGERGGAKPREGGQWSISVNIWSNAVRSCIIGGDSTILENMRLEAS